jgi:CRP-like cAMP-binding protein
MNTRLLECILNGGIVINSLEALRPWTAKFPTHPHLLKIYADLLADHQQRQSAADHYDRAARLFVEEGQSLLGVATKIRQWQTLSPQKEEIAAFLSAFRTRTSSAIPALNFWKNLTVDELLALYPIIENVCYPSGSTLKQLGEVETELNFIVAGELRESNYRMIEDQQGKFKKPIQILKPNDIFGAVYPFSEHNRSKSHIVTLKRTELIRINKGKLFDLCNTHPQFEPRLIDLVQIRHSKPSKKSSVLARKASRYSVSAPITLEILPDAAAGLPIRICGYSRDLSISGLCFLISANRIEESRKPFWGSLCNGDHKPTVRVILSIEKKMSLSISGKIVRSDKVLDHGQVHLALGIRFDDMSPIAGGAFFAFAESVGIMNQGSNAIAHSPEIRQASEN